MLQNTEHTKFHGWSPGPIGPFKGNNRGNKGKPTKIYNFDEKSDFALYGRWEALVTCKILPRGLGTISTPGKHISEKSLFLMFLTNLASHEIWQPPGPTLAALIPPAALPETTLGRPGSLWGRLWSPSGSTWPARTSKVVVSCRRGAKITK